MEQQHIQSVDDSGNVTENGQQDVDEEIGTATAFQEDTDWGDEDGEDDFDNVGSGEGHCEGWLEVG